MEKIKLTIPSTVYHISQIITGFLMLRQQGWDVEIQDCSRDSNNPFFDLPVALAQYRGKRLVYDLWDGYQDPENMKKALDQCDFYFKRSFSPEKNAALFPSLIRICPLNSPTTWSLNPTENLLLPNTKLS